MGPNAASLDGINVYSYFYGRMNIKTFRFQWLCTFISSCTFNGWLCINNRLCTFNQEFYTKHTKWTPELDEKLMNLRNQGMTFDNIAKEMDKSKTTVFFRIKKLTSK